MTTETITFRNIVSVLPPTSDTNHLHHRGDQQRGSQKTKRDVVPPDEKLPKPGWIRARAPSSSGRYSDIKDIVRSNALVTVCSEASCPNIGECWSKGTATFMIMGDKCTRRLMFNMTLHCNGTGTE